MFTVDAEGLIVWFDGGLTARWGGVSLSDYEWRYV